MVRHDSQKPLNVVLTGGGTLGSVSPLLAIIEKTQRLHLPWTFSFIGTRTGPERQLISKNYQLPYTAVSVAKLRRYVSWHNGYLPVAFATALWESVRALKRLQPDVVVAAGSFVAVPVIWAAHLLKIPSVIYQMDVRPGLANRLMARPATRIAVAFRHHIYSFDRSKTTPVGFIVRPSMLMQNREAALRVLGLSDTLPVVVVVGGGTGARALNQKVIQTAVTLSTVAQIVHITGPNKGTQFEARNYYPYEFLTDHMADALAAAEIVITRGGLATMAELAALGKPSLIVPMPDSHQEENAEFLRRHGAAAVLSQKGLSAEVFAKSVTKLLTDEKLKKIFRTNIKKLYEPDGLDRLVTIIEQVTND